MAASVKNARRKQYRTPGVVNGNLARDLSSYELERRLERSGQLAPDEYYVRHKESRSDVLSRQRAKAKAAVRPAQKVSPLAVLGFSGVAVLMVALLLCYIRINAISTNIVDMKEQISALEVEQVSLLTRYERAFDLATVKEAAQEAGMRQPEDSQIYYIDLPGQDQAVSYADESGSVLSRFFAAIGRNIYAAGEYFR